MGRASKYHPLLLLLTKDAALSERIAKALTASDEDAAAFFQQHHGKHFTNRGIDEPGNKEQTLCYLLDILAEEKMLYELDWKADVDELNYALELMSKGEIIGLLNEEDQEDAEGMFELIFTAKDRLKPLGWGLTEFPLDSDSHPIVLVPSDRLAGLEKTIKDIF